MENRNRPSRVPEKTRTNREKKKLEDKLASQRRTTIRNRAVLAGGATLALFGIVGMGYCAQQEGEAPAPITTSNDTDITERLPLPGITQGELMAVTGEVIDDYENFFNVDLDKDFILENTLLLPGISQMTQEQSSKYCYPVTNCTEYIANTYDDSQIRVYKEVFDEPFIRANNTPKMRNFKEDLLKDTMAHEITHLAATDVEMSDSLFSLSKKYINFRSANVDPSILEKGSTNGASFKFLVPGSDVFYSAFKSLEEAEAKNIARLLIESSGRPTDLGFDDPNFDNYYFDEAQMLRQLLERLDGGLDVNVKTLAKLRLEENGREQWCRIIGKRFGASEVNSLELGFQILLAIDAKNYQAFYELTRN